MLGFFKKKPPADPPTEKQLHYAKRIGIVVTSAMTRGDVSAAIGSAEHANPQLAEARERAKTRACERKFRPELLAEESRWNKFADSTEYMLAIYRRGKEIIVDVLRVNEAFINGRGKLTLGVAAPKLMKDRHTGQYLAWEKEFTLPIGKLLHYEALHEGLHWGDIGGYRSAVKRGLKIARKL